MFKLKLKLPSIKNYALSMFMALLFHLNANCIYADDPSPLKMAPIVIFVLFEEIF